MNRLLRGLHLISDWLHRALFESIIRAIDGIPASGGRASAVGLFADANHSIKYVAGQIGGCAVGVMSRKHDPAPS
jgi:hypothetical protein